MQPLRLLGSISLLLGVLACEPGQLPGLPETGARSSESGSARPRDPSLVSLDEEAEATRVYYQFTDERGRVRFVPTLALVPEAWRDRVGFVEMASPPPMSPADARRIRDKQMAKLPSSPARYAGATGADAAPSGSSEVIIYSADWCGACRKAKRYMTDKGIDFVERDVDDPEWKQEMIAKAGPGGIPVFDINGQILRGFSPTRLDELIDQAS